MSIEIRPLEQNDYPRWLELWRGYLAFYETKLPASVTATAWQRLLIPNEGHGGLVALEPAGKLIGFAHYLLHRSTWSIKDYCYLEDLFVDAKARGSGAGRALIASVEQAARAQNCARLYLTTAEQNATARGLYDKTLGPAGFVRYAKSLN